MSDANGPSDTPPRRLENSTRAPGSAAVRLALPAEGVGQGGIGHAGQATPRPATGEDWMIEVVVWPKDEAVDQLLEVADVADVQPA